MKHEWWHMINFAGALLAFAGALLAVCAFMVGLILIIRLGVLMVVWAQGIGFPVELIALVVFIVLFSIGMIMYKLSEGRR